MERNTAGVCHGPSLWSVDFPLQRIELNLAASSAIPMGILRILWRYITTGSKRNRTSKSLIDRSSRLWILSSVRQEHSYHLLNAIDQTKHFSIIFDRREEA